MKLSIQTFKHLFTQHYEIIIFDALNFASLTCMLQNLHFNRIPITLEKLNIDIQLESLVDNSAIPYLFFGIYIFNLVSNKQHRQATRFTRLHM